MKTHGLTYTPEYSAWCKMKFRCKNKKFKQHKDYGARGIKVCRQWESSFQSFLRDMGKKPFPSAQLDRIDNNSGYSPRNCRWTDSKTQQRNRRSNRLITIGFQTKPMSAWADESGIRLGTIWWRIEAGWAPDEAVSIPVRK